MFWRFLGAVKSGEHRIAPTTWFAAAAAVIYAISPIDAIPELILGPLGFVDDFGVVAVAGALFTREYRRWQASLSRR
ncbi:DUF1232 domain-containing protein [Salinibacterium sp. SYSU T00001]|uniref:DUF1232 domain-containing protein n=1 Tax=Homoserinimonas sedimenticola TaxID=2986805 RepID=UPI0022356D9D|nr:DUF1232 domain-containing protein [Salinibacterium sedimenticola]MCW4386169.1 DUF1232 domain-containing protein [Salinibacterium sedimenticola]